MTQYETTLRGRPIWPMPMMDGSNKRVAEMSKTERDAHADVVEAARDFAELASPLNQRSVVKALARLDALTTTDAEQPSPSSGLGSSAGVSE
jgi:hypothetical protein